MNWRKKGPFRIYYKCQRCYELHLDSTAICPSCGYDGADLPPKRMSVFGVMQECGQFWGRPVTARPVYVRCLPFLWRWKRTDYELVVPVTPYKVATAVDELIRDMTGREERGKAGEA